MIFDLIQMRSLTFCFSILALIGTISAAPKATWIPQRLRMQRPSFYENSIDLSQKQRMPQMYPSYGYSRPLSYDQQQQTFEQPQVYSQPQQTYEQPQVYSQPQQTYEQPQVYSQPQQTYEQPQVYSQPQQIYEQPQVYSQPQQNYGSSGYGLQQSYGQESCNPNPCLNEGRCISNGNSFTCKCPWGWTGTRCEICLTECASNPCKAPKKCKARYGGGYECVCPSDRAGANCEITNDLCSSNPCKNGAICSTIEGGSYTCECKQPWSGPNCDQVWHNPCTEEALRNADIYQYKNPWDRYSYMVCVDINRYHTMPCSVGTYFNENLHHCVPEGYNPPACPLNYCQNGGECLVDEYNLLKCVCKKGFSGDRCEVNIDECLLEGNSKCNGGTCVDQVNGYYCKCPNGIGLNCQETMKNPCTTHNLENDNYYHEVPSENFNSYIHCTGESTFTVNKCADNLYWHPEERTCTVEKPKAKYGACSDYPCKNGGECEEIDGKNYKCSCKNGYTGSTCEQMVDYCLSNPCQNGGRCLSYAGGYTCVCQDKVIDDCCCNGVLNPCPSKGELIPGVNNYYPHIFKNKYIHCDFDGRAFVRACAASTSWNQDVLSCIPENFKLDRNYLHDNVKSYGTEAYGYNIGKKLDVKQTAPRNKESSYNPPKQKQESSYNVGRQQPELSYSAPKQPKQQQKESSYSAAQEKPQEQSQLSNNVPQQQPETTYNVPQQSQQQKESSYSAPQQPEATYNVPQQQPEATYNVPQQSQQQKESSYSAPQQTQPSYNPPQQQPEPTYNVPQQSQQQQESSYSAPQQTQPSYNPPQQQQESSFYVPQQQKQPSSNIPQQLQQQQPEYSYIAPQQPQPFYSASQEPQQQIQSSYNPPQQPRSFFSSPQKPSYNLPSHPFFSSSNQPQSSFGLSQPLKYNNPSLKSPYTQNHSLKPQNFIF